MIHRALLGSLERFFGVLIEHYGGAFPPWIAPVQAVVIPVSEAFNDYAEKTAALLKKAGLRVNSDLSSERLNAKIRAAQTLKIPYMLVAGEREAADGSISPRLRDGRQLPAMKAADFIAYLNEKVETKALEL